MTGPAPQSAVCPEHYVEAHDGGVVNSRQCACRWRAAFATRHSELRLLGGELYAKLMRLAASVRYCPLIVLVLPPFF